MTAMTAPRSVDEQQRRLPHFPSLSDTGMESLQSMYEASHAAWRAGSHLDLKQGAVDCVVRPRSTLKLLFYLCHVRIRGGGKVNPREPPLSMRDDTCDSY